MLVATGTRVDDPTSSESAHRAENTDRPPAGWHLRAHVLYPVTYTWFVFLSAMDLMFTWTILHFGGREVNWVADHVIRRFGLVGVVALKFGVVTLVVCICEIVGRHRLETGRKLARWAIIISIIPVSAGFIQLIIAISRIAQIVDGDGS